MATSSETFAGKMDLPPQIPEHTVFPLDWHTQTETLNEIHAAQREDRDPERLAANLSA